MDRRALHNVAAKARRWVVRFAKRKNHSCVRDRADTTGFCAIGAAKLYELLIADKRFKDCEINPVVVDYACEGSHAYVVVSTDDEDLIVDVTADQFDMKPIEIRSAHNKHNDWFWGNAEGDEDNLEVFSGIEAFAKAVKEWDEQSPQKHGLLQGRI